MNNLNISIYKDKIKGMIIGSALGDVLGFPHEFRSSKAIYTGKLEFNVFVPSRFQQYNKTLPIGSISDDTESSLIIMRSLIKNKCYKVDEVCLDYMYWASGIVDNSILLSDENIQNIHTSKPNIGKNTRALFAGVKTLKGYKSRSTKVFAKEISKSNGALMRAHVLSLIPDYLAQTQDTNLSNPDPICLDCAYIHNTILRYCLLSPLYNIDKENIKNLVLQTAQTQDTKNVISQVINKEPRDVTYQKGYVLHALYCSLYALFHFDNYREAIDYIIPRCWCCRQWSNRGR